ncbi:leucine--tRNA ligase [Patescibacteria group bacterium]|nr:leucine--tRNA ligase [Patescibacteria group bacterium]
MAQYNASEVEKKWQEKWEESGIYKVNLKDKKKKKFYNLVMFPYPSGDKLHVGHWYNYGPADSYGRYMRMNGYNIFEPMGFDSFGLPAENYAIKTGTHPSKSIATNVEHMIKQLKRIGTMYDWDKTVITSTPEYYKWTQWIFLKLYEAGLAYKKEAPVNWCPSCRTVLANEQTQDGTCERCGSEITKKSMNQWFFKTRDYAEKLLDYKGLDWPDKTIAMQKNWIGKSMGIDISYEVLGLKDKITVYTTRPDTNFGATFIVVAPESEFVARNFEKFKDKEAVELYVEEAKRKTDIERIAEGRKKTGVFTGLQALNQLTGRKMPIFVSDFVLAHVGTGCVVGVPGHDLRDFEFAQEKGLEVIRVVVGPDGDNSPIVKAEQVQEEAGTMVNSGFLDGMEIMKAKDAIMDYIEEKGYGKRVTNYKLRDWLVSRQRYWGAPIPIVYCEKCGEVPVKEKDLPVELPDNKDFKPSDDGKSPLSKIDSFVKCKCPGCGGDAEREVDTMDTFVCSSWYYLRYPCTDVKNKAFDSERVNEWLPVDMYIGGPEHACMHLIYARFINMALRDLGFVGFKEPFKRLVHQGMITKDGAKMSKSKGNVVSPDEFIEKYGSDVFRMYLMFMGPFTDGGDWNDTGITGVARFVDRLWKLMNFEGEVKDVDGLKRALHKLIKKVSEDVEKFHFNTALAGMMEFVNLAGKIGIDKESKLIVASLIAPMAPHLAEECFEVLGGKGSIFDAAWPKFDKKLVVDDMVRIGVQVNGKVRGDIEVAPDMGKDEALKMAREQENVAKYLADGKVVKEIYVPGKIIGFVVK